MRVLLTLANAAILLASGLGPRSALASEEPAARTCPAGLGNVADCYGGKDRNGAYYLIANPKAGNGGLIVHAHGGPRHVPPAPDGADEDLVRFAFMVRAGYAWIGTTYRNPGYGVRLAAADVEHSRQIYWQRFGKPQRTILHGQSYGGNVVAKLAELDALDASGRPKYDGVLLTSAAVGKRIETYDRLIYLRVVFQHVCRNLPLPDEQTYPAWQGLPKDSPMTRDELKRRVDACTGADRAPASRTQAQVRNLAAITGATGEVAAQMSRRMELATFRLQDVVHNFLGGLNPFDNSRTVYRGSGDDDALNRGVERFAGTARARDLLAYDSDLHGGVVVPTITLHAKFDPLVAYQSQAYYRRVVERAGQGHLLLQLLTSEDQHSLLSESQYLSVLSELGDWIDTGRKPAAAGVARKCADYAAKFAKPCFFIAHEDE